MDNGAISEAIRHIVLSGIQIDIIDERIIGEDISLDTIMKTHFLINKSHDGLKVRKIIMNFNRYLKL